MRRQTSSSRTPVAGGERESEVVDLDDMMHNVLMSDELKDDIDPDDVHGDGSHEEQAGPSGAPRRPRRTSNFRCVVTLGDDQELPGDVLSFQRERDVRSVRFITTMRHADDICTGWVARVRVVAPSGLDVFDATFDEDDPKDVPDVSFDLSQLGPVLTLSFVVEDDSYSEEDSNEDTQEG